MNYGKILKQNQTQCLEVYYFAQQAQDRLKDRMKRVETTTPSIYHATERPTQDYQPYEGHESYHELNAGLDISPKLT